VGGTDIVTGQSQLGVAESSFCEDSGDLWSLGAACCRALFVHHHPRIAAVTAACVTYSVPPSCKPDHTHQCQIGCRWQARISPVPWLTQASKMGTRPADCLRHACHPWQSAACIIAGTELVRALVPPHVSLSNPRPTGWCTGCCPHTHLHPQWHRSQCQQSLLRSSLHWRMTEVAVVAAGLVGVVGGVPEAPLSCCSWAGTSAAGYTGRQTRRYTHSTLARRGPCMGKQQGTPFQNSLGFSQEQGKCGGKQLRAW
jgi:hypothetical protein